MSPPAHNIQLILYVVKLNRIETLNSYTDTKILRIIVIDRIRNGADNRLRKEQGGYRNGGGKTDQIFIPRNIVERVNEWQASLYINFIDFEKAFDSIHRESLWLIMRKYGVPENIIRIIRLFYDDFECAVEDQGEACAWFNIKTGVKQGCNMLGFLFLIIMDWVLRRTVKSGENGIRWRLTSKFDYLDFADDVALPSSAKQHIQNKTTRMNKEARRVGLKIDKEKTEVMRINAKSQQRITVDGQDISEVETFNYLGATICKEGGGGRNEGHQEQTLKGKRSFCKTRENVELEKHLKKNQS